MIAKRIKSARILKMEGFDVWCDTENQICTPAAHVVLLFDDNFDPTLAAFQKLILDPDLGEIQALLVSNMFPGNPIKPEPTSTSYVDLLVDHSNKFKSLKALRVGIDDSYDGCLQISWINHGDYSQLWSALPQLEALHICGGAGIRLGCVEHARLRSLTIETTNFNESIFNDLANSALPSLEELELWVYDRDKYQGEISLDGLHSIFTKNKFPKLKYLGLRNSDQADDIARMLMEVSFPKRLEVLDFSLGVLTDIGGVALLENESIKQLDILDVGDTYLSHGMIERLRNLTAVNAWDAKYFSKQGISIDTLSKKDGEIILCGSEEIFEISEKAIPCKKVQDFHSSSVIKYIGPVRLAVRGGTNSSIQQCIQQFNALMKDPKVNKLRTLIIGPWGRVETESVQPIIDLIVKNAEKLIHLRNLFVGDLGPDDIDYSWAIQGNYEQLWCSLPELKVLHIKGGNQIALGKIQHKKLNTLLIETQNIRAETLQGMNSSELPRLKRLELWLGGNQIRRCKQKLFAALKEFLTLGSLPKLRHLVIRDYPDTKELLSMLKGIPILHKLHEVDIVPPGTLGFAEAKALVDPMLAMETSSLNVLNIKINIDNIDEIRNSTEFGGIDLDFQREDFYPSTYE